ncbi:hypothetical protein V1517DRAFT_331152 [Lipomyces orientalis]|uniref:Uncharacterized protein n=1 Tax=Lipomyces orientalis TaxID=1233043 RepID=A0ACC3TG57_9ASCO
MPRLAWIGLALLTHFSVAVFTFKIDLLPPLVESSLLWASYHRIRSSLPPPTAMVRGGCPNLALTVSRRIQNERKWRNQT